MSIACEKCGKTNHTTAECTYFDGACRYCGVHGHRERDCRKKQAASKNSGETAAVVTTPGPTTGQVAFVERRQLEDESGWILGVMREATREPWTKTVGAVEFIVDSGLRGNDSQHRTGRQTWGGQSKELSVIVSHRWW